MAEWFRMSCQPSVDISLGPTVLGVILQSRVDMGCEHDTNFVMHYFELIELQSMHE